MSFANNDIQFKGRSKGQLKLNLNNTLYLHNDTLIMTHLWWHTYDDLSTVIMITDNCDKRLKINIASLNNDFLSPKWSLFNNV